MRRTAEGRVRAGRSRGRSSMGLERPRGRGPAAWCTMPVRAGRRSTSSVRGRAGLLGDETASLLGVSIAIDRRPSAVSSASAHYRSRAQPAAHAPTATTNRLFAMNAGSLRFIDVAGKPAAQATVRTQNSEYLQRLRGHAPRARYRRDDLLRFHRCRGPDPGEHWWALADSNRRPTACKYERGGRSRTTTNRYGWSKRSAGLQRTKAMNSERAKNARWFSTRVWTVDCAWRRDRGEPRTPNWSRDDVRAQGVGGIVAPQAQREHDPHPPRDSDPDTASNGRSIGTGQTPHWRLSVRPVLVGRASR